MLHQVPVEAIRAEIKRIRAYPCPTCGGQTHQPVDLDGQGEYLRFCNRCTANFAVPTATLDEAEEMAGKLIDRSYEQWETGEVPGSPSSDDDVRWMVAVLDATEAANWHGASDEQIRWNADTLYAEDCNGTLHDGTAKARFLMPKLVQA